MPDSAQQHAQRTGWLERDGACLRYRLRPGKGPTLVLVHELGGTPESWDACIDFLLPSRSTLCFEWRGAGLSTKLREPISFDQLVDDLHHVIANGGISGPMILVGVGAGAAMAIRCASRYPDQIVGIVAFVPALGISVDRRDATLRLASQIERDGMQAMMRMRSIYPNRLREQQAERWSQFRLRYLGNDPTSFAHLLRMVVDIDIWDDAKRVHCPALVLGGTYDIRPVSLMQSLASQLPCGRFEEIVAGHFISSQVPDQVAHAIERFMAALPIEGR